MPSEPSRPARFLPLTQPTQAYCASWAALAMLSVIDYLGAAYFGLTFTGPQATMYVCAGILTVSLLFYGMFGRVSRVGEMTRYLALWIASVPVANVFTYLLASLRFPVIDRELERFDRMLGFDWLIWYDYVNAHSAVKFVLHAAYASMILQVIFSILYFSHRDESHRNHRLWCTAMLALIITTIVSGIFPALGSYAYYGVVDAQHGFHLDDLRALLAGTLGSTSLDRIKGIITLPSYHAVCAVLLTYIYRQQVLMLLWAAPLNVLMLVATLSEGGHYLADLWAGAAVAVLCILIVERSASWSPRRAATLVTTARPERAVAWLRRALD